MVSKHLLSSVPFRSNSWALSPDLVAGDDARDLLNVGKK